MIQVEMSAEVRNVFGKGPMRRLRAAGMTPAVVYGAPGSELQAIQLDTKEFFKNLLMIQRRNAVLSINIDGVVRNVLIQDVQADPVRDTLVHADFYEIDVDKPRTFTVPLNLVGTSKGEDKGGKREIAVMQVSLNGNPLDVPDMIDVDVTEMNIGDSIEFSALNIPDNLQMVSAPTTVCVAVVAP
ncbi:MAG: 50S ribosomal protein L25 [Desulfobulbaceae bacterium]|uniref:Large ribosomal subunit protein bL25 n=1 Tax=Candidatus Desulfatifera sulfidica TaxID=2841691 RepID=A0A8J6N6A9_9BACT|nr:50S ribosomal protein L25 [Candidatus Desulfatifera sulfidica]